MYEVEINRNECRGCGACIKTSQILILDDDNLVAIEGGFIDSDNIASKVIKSLYEVETAASICPEDCFIIYDDDTGDEIEIERNSLI